MSGGSDGTFKVTKTFLYKSLDVGFKRQSLRIQHSGSSWLNNLDYKIVPNNVFYSKQGWISKIMG